MKIELIQYSKCGTCQKASKWLKLNNIDFETRDIISENPSEEELRRWIAQSGISVKKFFNVSGVKYRELNVKEIINTASEDDLISLLASDGKLIKRPILISNKGILIGFKEPEWEKYFDLTK